MKVEVTSASLLSECPFDATELQDYLYRLQDIIIYITTKLWALSQSHIDISGD